MLKTLINSINFNINYYLKLWFGNSNKKEHFIKQKAIKEYALKYNPKILVETGTYLGAMIEAQKDTFNEIYSVEVSKELYRKARTRFRKFKHIKLYQGDSG